MDLWPHQRFGIDETLRLIAAGVRRILLTSPTGGGKTAMMAALIGHFLDSFRQVVLYTNRKLLVEQTSRVLAAAGLDHGVRAAGYGDDRHRALQISSIQTEASRVLKSKRWSELHDADLVLVDEAHLHKEATAVEILGRHYAAGAAVVGLTATPLGLAHLYDELVVAGKTSELRACGALVRCDHYGPDEPDLRHVRRHFLDGIALDEEVTEEKARRLVMVPGVFGRVLDNYRAINPEGRPTILFAPGVGESLGFAEAFWEAGIPAAHIDGDEVWCNGVGHRTSRQRREEVLEMSRDGTIQVLCNRFVLREGIDAPWLSHGIFATVFGSLQSYLQSGGRLLRSHPGVDAVTLQDHGGNWWRYGSLNADRTWELGMTARKLAALREEGFRKPAEAKDPEPIRCPRCTRIIACLKCPCGWELGATRKSRPVIQADGSMVDLTGEIFKPRKIMTAPDGPGKWAIMVYRSRKAKKPRTFRAAAALFASENGWQYPDPSWPLMPKNPDDMVRLVSDILPENLR